MSLLGSLFPKKLYATEDLGNKLEVFDTGSELVFKFNGITYSKLSKESVFTHQYWDYFLPAAYLFKNPSVLIIGLGSGTIPYQMQKLLGQGISIDAVENSEKIKEIAEKFLPEKLNAKLIVADGADFVRKSPKSHYDIVILDAYFNERIPEQFLTSEFVESAYNALKPSGVLLVNFAMTFMGALNYARYVSKLKTRFKVYRVHTAITEGNIIILCSKLLDDYEINKRIKEAMPSNADTLPLIRNYESMKEE